MHLTSIRDVSKRAGVSIATVSRVMSTTGYVSEGARTAVLRAAEELHYIPSFFARGLKTKKSGLVALLIPQIVSTYFVYAARGIADAANRNGYQLIICNTDDSLDKQESYVSLLIGSSVDGIIIASVNRSPKPLQPLLQRNIPVVLMDRLIDDFPADIVRGDSFNGMRILTQHLLELGHTRIALVNGDMETYPARDRLKGFQSILAERRVLFDERLVSDGVWQVESAEHRVDELIDSQTEFSAIIGANSAMSVGAMRSLRKHGLRVPNDRALAGFDDVELASDLDPFLTVLTQPAHTMGTFAMNMLLERMGDQYSGPPRDVVLAPWLVVRRSSGVIVKTSKPMQVELSRPA
jgi:LacI family transcriptional regulator